MTSENVRNALVHVIDVVAKSQDPGDFRNCVVSAYGFSSFRIAYEDGSVFFASVMGDVVRPPVKEDPPGTQYATLGTAGVGSELQ